jgi:hypothetical protein
MSISENKKLLHNKKHEIETNILLSDTKKTIDTNNDNNTKKKITQKDKKHYQFVLDRLLKNLDNVTKTINTP